MKDKEFLVRKKNGKNDGESYFSVSPSSLNVIDVKNIHRPLIGHKNEIDRVHERKLTSYLEKVGIIKPELYSNHKVFGVYLREKFNEFKIDYKNENKLSNRHLFTANYSNNYAIPKKLKDDAVAVYKKMNQKQ